MKPSKRRSVPRVPFRGPADIYAKLLELLAKLALEPRRDYNDPKQWRGGVTGGQAHACVYVLWGQVERPIWIGETGRLGRRSGTLFQPHQKWTTPPTHVQYLSDSDLDDPWVRRMFERFLICLWHPLDNVN